MTKDLTKGNTLGLIINITLPVLSGYLFQQLYSLVDTMIVGKGVGVDALAAVGSTGSVNFLIIGFCIGTSAGVTIPVAQSFGAGNYIKMRRYIYHSFLLIGAVSVVLTVATVLYCRPLLQLMQTPEDILDQAARYIRIIFMGIPFILLFNLVSSILRAVGNNKNAPDLFNPCFSTEYNSRPRTYSCFSFRCGRRGLCHHLFSGGFRVNLAFST